MQFEKQEVVLVVLGGLDLVIAIGFWIVVFIMDYSN